MTYTLTPEGVQCLKQKKINETAIAIASVILAIFDGISLFLNPSVAVTIFLWPNLILLIILLVVGYFWIYQRMNMYISFKIRFDKDALTLDQAEKKPIVIHQSHVVHIFKIDGQGMRIVASDPCMTIMIPLELSEYDQFVSKLKSWIDITPEKKIGAWGILGLSFALLFGLAMFVSTAGRFPDFLRSIQEIYLILLWLTFIGTELISEGTSMNLFINISKKERPWFYWMGIAIECIPFLWLPHFEIKGFLNLGTSMIIGYSLFVSIWIYTLAMLVIKSLSNHISTVVQ
jgi:hypothetical protein